MWRGDTRGLVGNRINYNALFFKERMDMLEK